MARTRFGRARAALLALAVLAPLVLASRAEAAAGSPIQTYAFTSADSAFTAILPYAEGVGSMYVSATNDTLSLTIKIKYAETQVSGAGWSTTTAIEALTDSLTLTGLATSPQLIPVLADSIWIAATTRDVPTPGLTYPATIVYGVVEK